MKQILQNIRSGKLSVGDVPDPTMSAPGVLVATEYSVISAGTEKLMMDFAGKSLIGKAKARPDQVRKVLDKIKRDGLKATLQTVFTQLDQPMPLGYSASGVVLATTADISHVKVGDRVACAGSPHCEVMFVRKNLVVPIPRNVDSESAAFTTMGSIALQGVRVAELVMGEKVAIVGLGVLGLIAGQLARAAGCRVLGTDLNPQRQELARKLGFDWVCGPEDISQIVGEMTGNVGVDAVIVTAGAKSNAPIEMSAEIARKKGRISMVGAVTMNLPRRPFYYKELQLRLSCSYGPGRYDAQYEEKGIDYPQAYVPWTEQRNMSCVLDMMDQNKLDIKPLITHQFPIEQGEDAYNLIGGGTGEPFLGVVLTYPQRPKFESIPAVKSASTALKTAGKDKIGVGVIGAGNFANLMLFPALKDIPEFGAIALADLNGSAAEYAKGKYGFDYATSDHEKMLADDRIDIIFITTRHDAHAPLIIAGLEANKHVMVEKPLCLNEDELRQIIDVADKHPDRLVMLGFNRRFAPMTVELKKRFAGKSPFCMNYICNAGFSPKDSWTQDPQVGGGRIIGEACHFIDWMIHMAGSAPTQVYAQSIGRETGTALRQDNVMISLQFEDGSIGTVSYLACGDKSYTKEYVKVFGSGCVGIIEDFRKGSFISGGQTQSLKASGKGHLQQWQALARAITRGEPAPIPFEDTVCSTWTTFKVIDSLNCNQAVEI